MQHHYVSPSLLCLFLSDKKMSFLGTTLGSLHIPSIGGIKKQISKVRTKIKKKFFLSPDDPQSFVLIHINVLITKIFFVMLRGHLDIFSVYILQPK